MPCLNAGINCSNTLKEVMKDRLVESDAFPSQSSSQRSMKGAIYLQSIIFGHRHYLKMKASVTHINAIKDNQISMCYYPQFLPSPTDCACLFIAILRGSHAQRQPSFVHWTIFLFSSQSCSRFTYGPNGFSVIPLGKENSREKYIDFYSVLLCCEKI